MLMQPQSLDDLSASTDAQDDRAPAHRYTRAQAQKKPLILMTRL